MAKKQKVDNNKKKKSTKREKDNIKHSSKIKPESGSSQSRIKKEQLPAEDIHLKKTESSKNQGKQEKNLLEALIKEADVNVNNNSAEEVEIDPEALRRGDKPMNIVEHLDEFRSRLLIVLVTVIALTVLGFYFSDILLNAINKPFLESGYKLNIFNLVEGFVLRIKASFVTGLLIGLPLLVYHLWQYIKPAIDIDNRKFAVNSIVAAIILFYIGLGATYFYLLPLSIKVLLSFTPPDMENMINASKYFNFAILFAVAIGITFEMPIIIMILTRIGIVSPAFLISKRKYAIVLIWIFAAVITPTTDPLTLTLVAIPLMLLYELSIVISKFIVIRKKRKELSQ
ncbi:MAG: twin-arginine translocase subunit TatC [Spirochaetes bacterium]|nr:twin-arginine translocase subunit TatC [Spirochaetota bacterium]